MIHLFTITILIKSDSFVFYKNKILNSIQTNTIAIFVNFVISGVFRKQNLDTYKTLIVFRFLKCIPFFPRNKLFPTVSSVIHTLYCQIRINFRPKMNILRHTFLTQNLFVIKGRESN